MSGAACRRRVAVVTGAGRAGGIGAAIARRLLADGLRVVVSDIGRTMAGSEEFCVAEASELDTTAKALNELGDVHAVECDVRSESAVEALLDAAVERFGRVDVMVNNAGIGQGLAPIVETDLRTWQLHLDVMSTGVFLGIRAAARRMIEAGRGGRIITIASQAGKSGMPLLGPYTAAKFSVVGLTQVAAHELGEYGISVNAVCPGTVDTPLLDLPGGLFDAYARRFGMEKERYRARVVKTIPLQRLQTPDDVAAAVSFLSGPDAGYITGEALNVTGGQEMH
jgi:NAD(P)-dependent dehydrogenase (short-subunit alcohol dehydrogenase family)